MKYLFLILLISNAYAEVLDDCGMTEKENQDPTLACIEINYEVCPENKLLISEILNGEVKYRCTTITYYDEATNKIIGNNGINWVLD